ncbi:MAG: hypothetical protein WC718_19100, partial [Phycisphaerales bacterium]
RLQIQYSLHLPEAVARHHVRRLADQTILSDAGAWTAATRTLTDAGSFTELTTSTRTWLYLHDAGSGTVIPGWYRVVSRTNDNSVVLDREIRTPPAVALAAVVIDVRIVRGALADMAGAHIRDRQNLSQEVRRLLPVLPLPVYPAVANVWHGTATYGPDGDDFTPTKVASSIANCEPANILNGVVIDDVTGTHV